MNLLDQPKTDVSIILLDVEQAIEYVLQRKLLKNTIGCSNEECEGTMKLIRNKKFLNNVVYKCIECKKEKKIWTIFLLTIFLGPGKIFKNLPLF
jgi:hypothetical protein